MTDTPLDRAHAELAAAPDDDRARLRFHERIADAELFLLLAAEAEGDIAEPEVFPVEDTSFALAFDTEARLAEFAGRIVPYAALPGRVLIAELAGAGLGLALNPEVAPSSWLMAPDDVAWLARVLDDAPQEAEARPEEIAAPADLPEPLLRALDAKLPGAAGLARSAYLAAVTWAGGGRGHLMAFVDALPGSEPALARAVREALVFSGLEAGAIDVTFVRAASPLAARLARVGLRFDLPEPEPSPGPSAPGMDPDRPPRLK